jgi:predicted nuclease of predicted toxin-antitoxin system
VKLLLDANISRRLIPRISGTFPDSSHVALLDLGDATDDEIWRYALNHGFAIVSKDEDFHQRALVSGPPPKVIWVRLGNCTTSDIEQAIQDGHDTIMAFLEDETASFLTLD